MIVSSWLFHGCIAQYYGAGTYTFQHLNYSSQRVAWSLQRFTECEIGNYCNVVGSTAVHNTLFNTLISTLDIRYMRTPVQIHTYRTNIHGCIHYTHVQAQYIRTYSQIENSNTLQSNTVEYSNRSLYDDTRELCQPIIYILSCTCYYPVRGITYRGKCEYLHTMLTQKDTIYLYLITNRQKHESSGYCFDSIFQLFNISK